ncbi:hypothetical protein ABT282_22960 [Streptomyces sp. NPDC000927]|uniref:hypothetical protein n=1 Tax=unclassified Streptomyces TaxID=2593676 RepID=UPI0033341B62
MTAALANTPALVNGTPAALIHQDCVPVSVMGFAIREGRITQIQDPLALGGTGSSQELRATENPRSESI